MSDSLQPHGPAYQAPLSMEFSRQESWSGLPFPSLGDLPNPAIDPRSLPLQADALPSEPPGKPMVDGEPLGNSGLPQAMLTGISPVGRAHAAGPERGKAT